MSVGEEKTSAQSFVWVEPGQTETMHVVFFRSLLPEYMEKVMTGGSGYPGGFRSHWITPDLGKLNRVTISKARLHQEMRFSGENTVVSLLLLCAHFKTGDKEPPNLVVIMADARGHGLSDPPSNSVRSNTATDHGTPDALQFRIQE